MDAFILSQANGASKTPSLEARQFVIAFIPTQTQSNISKLWSDRASEALRVIVDFRSACNRWAALGEIAGAELVEQIDALDRVGLADFTDELIALGTVANCHADVNGGQR